MIETHEIPIAWTLVAQGHRFETRREGKWVIFVFPDATEEDTHAYYNNDPLPIRTVIDTHRVIRVAIGSPRR